MPYANLGDYSLYYEEYMPDSSSDLIDDVPVIFLHGFTLDRRMWQSQMEFFGANRRAIFLDALGHGKSDAPESGYGREDRVEHLLQFIDCLKFDQIHVVGLSMGGSTAIGFALKYQHRLASMTLIDTGAAGYSPSKRISRIDQIAREDGLEAARKKWMKSSLVFYKEDKKHIRKLMNAMMLDHSGAIWMDPKRGQYPTQVDLEYVHAITVPTMIFVGELDKIFVPLAEGLHKRIQGSRMSIFENTGHMLNMESHNRLNDELKLFLDGLSD
jgi:pimeloyl-ACP methyl ester carboxylesterase